MCTKIALNVRNNFCTVKSFSEALIFASTNPQYDDRLFIELQVQYIKIPSSNLERTCCVQKLFLTFRAIFVHNMISSCSAKRGASNKDLPIWVAFFSHVLMKHVFLWCESGFTIFILEWLLPFMNVRNMIVKTIRKIINSLIH